MNDPFELIPFNLSDKHVRQAVYAARNSVVKDMGFLCFSRTWKNPLLWSHYADRHRGVCLGFDFPDSLLKKIQYVAKRINVNPAEIDPRDYEDVGGQFIYTKFAHWKYEAEVRAGCKLDHSSRENGLYFMDFDSNLRPAEVIVGARCGISRAELTEALGPLARSIDVFKSRPAFGKFEVCRNKDESLWT